MKTLCFCLLFTTAWGWSAEPTLVYLVRHAEKVDQSKDPDLSEAGYRRVETLRRFFAKIPIDLVVATQYQRTQRTVRPIAGDQNRALEVIPAEHPEKLVEQIRQNPGKTILVAGHSNTVPDLISRLKGPKVQIQDHEYNDLFLLILADDQTTVLQSFQITP